MKGKSVPLAAFRLLELSGERPAPGRESRLVGRSEELAALERELEQAVSDRRCRLLTVVGEPGVGKSRLVAELAARSRPRARVVGGACLSYGEGITFWAVAQIVRELAGIGEAGLGRGGEGEVAAGAGAAARACRGDDDV